MNSRAKLNYKDEPTTLISLYTQQNIKTMLANVKKRETRVDYS